MFLDNIPPQGKKFYLFGYPVAHSVAPTFHNYCFSNWSQRRPANTYETWPTSKVTDTVLNILSCDDCGGSAVTMPIKAAILPYLDEISIESKVTGACNTIVKVPTSTGYKLVGQNTDILGVRNALLHALRSQFPILNIRPEASYSTSLGVGGVLIGGGATTRSAAYALTLLGLSPLYIVNRDVAEVRAVQKSLAHINVIHLSDPEDVEFHLGQEGSVQVLMIVGAIPSTPPTTAEERRVYSTVSTILTLPYVKPTISAPGIPMPNRRIFLEMAYKPRLTPMLQMATAHGWHGVDGIQAMIEQGLAQQRMWYASNPSLRIGSDDRILSPELEQGARKLCETMGDVILIGEEVDTAKNKRPAEIPLRSPLDYQQKSAL